MKKNTFVVLITIFILLICNFCNLKTLFVKADENDTLTEVDCKIDSLDQYNYISLHDTKKICVSETLNSVAILDENITYYNDSNIEKGIYKPKFAFIINDEIAVIDELNRIQTFDKNFEYKKTYQHAQNKSKTYTLPNIISACTDYLGNIFMQSEGGILLKYSPTEQKIIEILTSENTFKKIAINPNGNLLAQLSSTNAVVTNLESEEKITIEIENANDLVFDSNGNLFILTKKTENIVIQKYLKETFLLENEKTINLLYNNMAINIETGEFCFTNEKMYSFYSENFANNPSSENSPVKITSTTLNQSEVIFAKNITETKLFATPVSFSSSENLPIQTNIIVLSENIEQNENMYFCLVTLSNKEKLGYILKSQLIKVQLNESEESYLTICKNVEIKTYPTKNSGIFSTINQEKSKITVINTACDFIDFDGNYYFAVKLESGIGYINQNFLQKENNFQSDSIETKKINENSTQFVAYILIVSSLLIATIFVCIIIDKKLKQ